MKINIDKTEKFYLLNSTLIDTKNEIPEISGENKIFYEVIRVVKGKPLFLDEHLERLQQSTILSNIQCFNLYEVKYGIERLLKANYVEEKNLKLTFYCDNTNELKSNLFAYFVESHYPSEEAYLHGVRVELMPMKRNNPNVKLENPLLRGSADKLICLSQTHEVLLVNDHGFITEGSRSNFFAVYGNELITPPSNQVLEGITRKMVIQIAKDNSIECVEKEVHPSDIEKMDGAFITGTSSKVLPIARIGDYNFKSIPITTRKMIELYDQLVERSLNEYNL